MLELIEEFSAIFGLLSFILAVVSIYLFLKSKKEKKPMFCIRSINLIGDLYNEIVLSFDFLEKNEGAVVNLLHTSKSLKDVKFTGKIKGVKIKSLSEKNGNGPKGSHRRVLINLVFILLAYTLMTFAGFPVESLIDPNLGNYSGLISSTSVLMIYLYLIYSEVKMPEEISSYMNTTGSTPEKVET
jgi:hypothetical protein